MPSRGPLQTACQMRTAKSVPSHRRKIRANDAPRYGMLFETLNTLQTLHSPDKKKKVKGGHTWGRFTGYLHSRPLKTIQKLSKNYLILHIVALIYAPGPFVRT